jgi:uroporphyrinogen-III synthase
LLESLQDKELKGKKFCIPRTSNATPTLTDNLKARGAQVDEVYVYESGLPGDKEMTERFFADLKSRRIDAIVFGSGLSAKNIFKMLSGKTPAERVRSLLNGKITTVAIGPTTADALKEMGIKIDVMPEDYLFENALEALAKHWSNS